MIFYFRHDVNVVLVLLESSDDTLMRVGYYLSSLVISSGGVNVSFMTDPSSSVLTGDVEMELKRMLQD